MSKAHPLLARDEPIPARPRGETRKLALRIVSPYGPASVVKLFDRTTRRPVVVLPCRETGFPRFHLVAFEFLLLLARRQ